MKNEQIKSIDNFINQLNSVSNIYEIETNKYDEKYQLILSKIGKNNSSVFGIEINFYSNFTIDAITIDLEGDILSNLNIQMKEFNDLFEVNNYIKSELK
jgi:hypothetical protein